MDRALKVLHLEDDRRDADLIREKLDAAGVACDVTLAREREAFEAALKDARYDVVLLDYNIPGYDGMLALRRARDAQPDTPVLIISGALEEEKAVEFLKAGATDYLLKHRLQRLAPAVQRALREAAERLAWRRDEDALRKSESRLELALEASGLATWDWDLRSGAVSFSRQWWGILGYEPGEIPLQVEAWEKLAWPDDLARVKSALADHLKGSVPTLNVEYRMRAKAGEWRWIRTVGRVVESDAAGRATRSIGTHGDVTERKQAEERIRRLNRIHAVLSGINSAIVRAAERQALLDEACRIAVEQGGFRMAWIGILDARTLELAPAAHAGFDDGFLAQCRFSAHEDAPGGHSTSAAVLRTGKAIFINEVESDRGLIYKEQMLARGYRAIIVLPLAVEGRCVGLLSLYAAEAGVFDAAELKLLGELAADVSFALDHLEKRERLNYLAYYDELTGLPNRALFYDRVGQILKRIGNAKDIRAALVVIDLDRFRDVNTAGRHVGDAVLKEVARRLSDGRLGPQHVAHLGADTFAAILGDVRDDTELASFLERRVREVLQAPVVTGGQRFQLSARAGIALFPGDGADADALFRNAEAALKKAKQSGDRYLFYTPALNARVAERLSLKARLTQALDRGQFELHYQPQVLISTGEPVGVEALIRWRQPDAGLVSPAEFIPIAEETGLIVPIGEWVLKTACAQNKAWQAAGLPPLTMSVNLSAVQFRLAGLVRLVGDILAETGLAPRDLDLELTESMVMGEAQFAVARMQELKTLGVTLSMDDFGTGYSNLSSLREFPLHRLKMDQSFVRGLPASANAAAISRAIVGMGHSLGLRVLAEGVETAAQAEFLIGICCDDAQGYFYSKPLPAPQCETWLRKAMERRAAGRRD